jgi:hypothetical protein
MSLGATPPPPDGCAGTNPDAKSVSHPLYTMLMKENQQNLKQEDDGGSDSDTGWIIFIIVLGVILMGLSIWAYFEFFSSQRKRINSDESRDIGYCNSLSGDAKSKCIQTAMKGARQSRNITNVGEMATAVATVWPRN